VIKYLVGYMVFMIGYDDVNIWLSGMGNIYEWVVEKELNSVCMNYS
jgi:hypothetical protein